MTRFRHGNTTSSKLTPSDVLELRRLYVEEGWTQRALAERYNLSVIQIGRIVRGESWRQYQKPMDKNEIKDSEARFRAWYEAEHGPMPEAEAQPTELPPTIEFNPGEDIPNRYADIIRKDKGGSS